MSRMPALLATVALIALSGTPTLAADPTAATAAQARAPSSAAVRATYDRMEALSRSVFWASEQQADPTDAVAGVKLAQALRELGRYDQAAEAAQATLTIQPNNLDALLELGRAHIARGQAFYGVAPLEQARDLAPRDWRPYSLLGVAYEQVRRTDDARAAWNQALALSPDNPDVLTNAATAALTHGDAPGAETLLRRAVAQPTASAKVRQNLAMVLGLQGKMGEAEQILRRELPPEQAEQNLQWLRSRSTGGAATSGGGAVSPSPATDTARTWNSLQGG
ncbi:tetratricopeptide repeat protein [Brevundimonas sp. 'scallop']|uniref:tetratricopeptide repeat protein n=1 Tax=Brevundimonas sp. 'scallop' TaxID=2562582 RepID=UPI0013E1933C|nr:tetratricopeptide repeat protein [Brevundimonas sp. 'scallop']QIF80633.1 tetratricopeptide repeat protein [Brevundimonas sp. 'scallop']